MAQRLGFTKLVGRMEAGDVLIVAKLDRLDRLGRDALDVSTTVKQLGEQGVGVHCLAQGKVDLTSSAGTMTMNVLNAVAQFERDLLIDRTQAGMMRAKDADNKLGRPSRLSDEEKQRVLNALAAGESISAVTKRLATSRQTVMRVRDSNL